MGRDLFCSGLWQLIAWRLSLSFFSSKIGVGLTSFVEIYIFAAFMKRRPPKRSIWPFAYFLNNFKLARNNAIFVHIRVGL